MEESSSSEDEDYVPPGEEKDEDSSSESGDQTPQEDNQPCEDEQDDVTLSSLTGRKSAKAERMSKKELKASLLPSRRPPKRPCTAYIFFSKTESPKFKGIEFKELQGLLSSKWKSLSSAEKQPYEEMGAKDKERYQKEMAEFQKSQAGREYSNLIAMHSKSKSSSKSPHPKKARKKAKMGARDKEKAPADSNAPPKCEPAEDPLEIPVYTDRFLEFNRARDLKLRQMRRAVADVEQENAMMRNQLLAIQATISRSEQDTVRLCYHGKALHRQLTQLSSAVQSALQQIPPGQIPGLNQVSAGPQGSESQTVDQVLDRLSHLFQSDAVSPDDKSAIRTALKTVVYPS